MNIAHSTNPVISMNDLLAFCLLLVESTNKDKGGSQFCCLLLHTTTLMQGQMLYMFSNRFH